MAIICAEPGLTGMINLDPDCVALQAPGGINKRIYIGSLADVAGFTQNTDGELLTLVMKTGKKLYTMSGKKLTNSTSNDLQVNENNKLFGHTVTFLAYVSLQTEKNAIEGLSKVEDLFIVVEKNTGKLEAFGLIGDQETASQGLALTALAGGSGTALADTTAYTLTFSGAETKLPVYTKFGETRVAELTYLDALLVAAA